MNLYEGSFAVTPVTGMAARQGLYPYQEAAAEQLLGGHRQHAIMAHHPGAGKTAIACAALNHAIRGGRQAIVVCPPSIKAQWAAQLIRWCGDANASRVELLADSVLHKRTTLTERGSTVVIDEVHRFKTRSALRTRALFGGRCDDVSYPGITTGAACIVALTGTPVIASPIDLFPVLKAMGFADAKTFVGFTEKYCPPYYAPVFGGRMDVRYDRPKDLDVLARKLRETVLIRPNRKDYLDQLPPVRTEVFPIKLRADPAEAFAGAEISEQNATEPSIAEARRLTGEAKVNMIRPWLTELLEGGNRPVIWVWHQSVAALIALHLECPMIHGGTPMDRRKEFVSGFIAGNHKALVMSIAAAGTGLDGLQHATDLSVFVEESFSPHENEQAVARVWRTGQTAPCRVIRVVSDSVIDFAVARANQKKTKTAQEALQ